MTYEAGIRVQRGGFDTDFVAFLTDVDDGITKQSLILPPGAVGTELGGEVVTAQNANGVVFVDASPNPVLVRTNFDDARVVGCELSLSYAVTERLRLSTIATYLRAEDRRTGAPPNIEGGTPPPEAYVMLRFTTAKGRAWIEPYLHLADRQTRISSLDLVDRRTGAGRSQSSIASFFDNGARARGLVGPGSDATPGTSDDVLLATGETLAEVQLRVLGPGLEGNSLHPTVPGYWTLGVRGGIRLGPGDLLIDLENLGDENYRGPSWGMDAPGRGLFLRYSMRFGSGA
jgi:hemoglobin/transferrin/lactoferrin receptor protein